MHRVIDKTGVPARSRHARHLRVVRCVLLLPLAAAVLGGCYYTHLGAGQSDIILGSEPIERALARKQREHDRLANLAVVPAAAEPERQWRLNKLAVEIERLGFVLDVRRYASEGIGLARNDSYTVYFDTGSLRAFPTYVVSAAHRTRLEPIRFDFPIVGRMPYKGFFVRDWAEREAEALQRRGFDVYVRPVSAYSTLGYFRDPVFTPMLTWNELTLAGVVIHEMLHATIWKDGDEAFNESLAVFFERVGALEYLRERYGADHPQVRDAWERWHDQDRYSRHLVELRDAVRALYAQPLLYEQMLQQRQRLFREYQLRYRELREAGELRTDEFDWFARRPLNNAVLQTMLMYNAGLDVYIDVWKTLGENLRLTLPVFREAVRHADPRAYLRHWLSEHEAPPPGEPASLGDVGR